MIKTNGQLKRKSYILFRSKRDEKTRKYDCLFKLRENPILMESDECWRYVRYHNQNLSQILVGHFFVVRLKFTEHSLLIDMTKSQVKHANIFLTFIENYECDVITIKQVYNATYIYKQSLRDLRIELQ